MTSETAGSLHETKWLTQCGNLLKQITSNDNEEKKFNIFFSEKGGSEMRNKRFTENATRCHDCTK